MRAKTPTRPKRKHGQGRIYLQGKVYYLSIMVNGERIIRSLKTADRRKAESEAKKYQELASARDAETIALHVGKARAIIAEADKAEGLAIADAWPEYVKRRRNAAPVTVALQETRWKRFAAWAADRKLADLAAVTDADALAYATDLAATDLTAKTRNDCIAAVRMVFDAMGEVAGIAANPFRLRNVPKESAEHVSHRPLSREELTAVLDKARGEGVRFAPELYCLLCFGVFAGMRLGDAAMATWQSIDFPANVIRFIPRKVRRHRIAVTVPLHPTLRAALAEAEAWHGVGDYILPGIADAYERDSSAICKAVAAVFQAAGLVTTEDKDAGKKRDKKGKVIGKSDRHKNIAARGFHSLRHSFVSICAAAGVPLATVQAIVGHANPEVTRVYTHIGRAELDKAVAALPALGQGAEPDPAAVALTELRRACCEVINRLPLKDLQRAAKALKAEVKP